MSESFSPALGYLSLSILVAIAGAYVGSFVAKLVYRLEVKLEPKALLTASICPDCGKKLRAVDKIPILSYILLKGKCYRCKAPISKRYLIFEIIGAVLPFLTGYLSNFNLSGINDYFFLMTLTGLLFITWDHFEITRLPGVIVLVLSGFNVLLGEISLTEALSAGIIGLILMYLTTTWLERSERGAVSLLFMSVSSYLGIISTFTIFIFFIIAALLLKGLEALEQKPLRLTNFALTLLIIIDFCFKEYINNLVLSIITFIFN